MSNDPNAPEWQDEPETELSQDDAIIRKQAVEIAQLHMEIAALKKRVELLESGWHGSYEANGQQTELL